MSIPHGICGTEEVADYLQKLLISELRGGDEEPNMPDWPLEFLEEANYAVKLLLQAIKNKSKQYSLSVAAYRNWFRADELVGR